MTTTLQKTLYWIATILIAFVLSASGLFKLLGGEKTIEMAKGLGGTAHLMQLGILELIIVLFWCIKRTGVLGALLAMCYIGGAISVHYVNNQPIGVVVVIEILIWIASVIRFPELTRRILNKPASSSI